MKATELSGSSSTLPSVTIIEFSGKVHELDAEVGLSLMECARDNMVSGIEAECGGCCSCATCHCYVDEPWLEQIGKAEGQEADLLAATSAPKPNSRLSCQITISDQMDGLVVRLPEFQY